MGLCNAGEAGVRSLAEAVSRFLRNLLKDQPYVALAYMTGILPVKNTESILR